MSTLLTVAKAAAEYIAECENPAPDLIYRGVLRKCLIEEIKALPEDVRREIGWSA